MSLAVSYRCFSVFSQFEDENVFLSNCRLLVMFYKTSALDTYLFANVTLPHPIVYAKYAVYVWLEQRSRDIPVQLISSSIPSFDC